MNTEQEEAREFSWGLGLIDGLSRHGLLVALDWERSRESTARLRKRTRMRWIKGELHKDDLWNARNCEAMQTQPSRRAS